MSKYFNALTWFKLYTGNKKLNKKNARSLLYFSLIWSTFEQFYFNDEHQLNIRNLRMFNNLISQNLNQDSYTQYIHHFHNRYFEQDVYGSKLFEALNLNEADEIFVRETIGDCLPKENFVPALLLIANRFRNNFLHGRKDVIKLHTYSKEFNVLNRFLVEFIEQTGDDNRFNKRRLKH